jgi:hypothetical protein
VKIVGVVGNSNGFWRGFLNKLTGRSEANLEGTRTPHGDDLTPLMWWYQVQDFLSATGRVVLTTDN